MPLPKAGSSALYSNSFFIFIIRFFPSLANLLVLIWYSRHLPQAVYGNYQQFWIQLNVFYPLACFGIHVLVITYSRESLLGLLSRLRPLHFVSYGIWVTVLGGIFAYLQNRNGLPFFIPFLFIISFSLSIILEALLIVSRNYAGTIIMSLLYASGFCCAHWYLLGGGLNFNQLFSYLLLLSVLRLVGYALMVRSSYKHCNTIPMTDAAIPAVRSLWLHLGAYDVSQTLFSWIDKFIMSFVLTASLSAVYFNGAQNIPFLPLMLGAAGSAVLMQLAGGGKADERTDLIRLMNQSGRMLSCIVFPVFFFLLLFRYDLVVGLLSDKYISAVPVFAASLMALPVKAYSFTTVLQRMHKGNIINAGAILDLLLACVLMYPMYCWLGLPGVALSFVVTTYLQAVFYLFYSARLLQVGVGQLIPLGNWLIKLIVFACLFIAIRYAGHVYFTRNITLILGGVVTVAGIATAMLLEISKQKKHVGT
jgi:O-antigen/teichoic acid export membrane protein